jgi:hypothetical protein
MLLPLWLNLDSTAAPAPPLDAIFSVSLPTIYISPMRPLWVSENAEDTIVVTPNPSPVGSFQ